MTCTSEQHASLSPAAYRVTASQIAAADGPYLVLECPYEHDHAECGTGRCVSNLLTRALSHGCVRLADLVKATIHHDLCHGAPGPDHHRLRELIYYGLGEYRLHAAADEHPFMVLNCPNLDPATANRCPSTVDGRCVANLLPSQDEQLKTVSVDLGTLVRLAAEHEVARAQTLAAELGADNPAQLRSRLADLRDSWTTRRLAAAYVRESADGATAHIASVRTDLYARLISELDEAVNGD